MSIKRLFARTLTLIFLCSATLFSQENPPKKTGGQPPPVVSAAQEFPVTLRQNVVAGKTPVGTKVEARLTLATLISGKVAPEGAIFSGVVVESTAKSETGPSRLSVRVDSIHWKTESAPIKAYLTSWYYPVLMPSINNDTSSQHLDGAHGGTAMRGSRPGTPPTAPFPNASQQGADVPMQPASNVSDHRVEMKDVESERATDGTVSISSSRANLKLDKSTTYVLATGELTASK
jgi:hypothetical protein